MFLSVFDLYKIGIGPSSSHTMGPMTAAARFLAELKDGRWPRPHDAVVARLRVILHGSLAFTGVGHATDRAVMLGLAGFVPATVDPDAVDAVVGGIAAEGRVQPDGHPAYAFEPVRDLVFDRKTPLPGHANGMAFEALDRNGALLLRRIYYSIGGGFVVDEDELQRKDSALPTESTTAIPFPFSTAGEMLAMADRSGLSIGEMQRANERVFLSERDLDERLDAIAGVMADCVRRGLKQDGIMPGGLKIRRRAKAIHERLEADAQRNVFQPLMANDWLSVYAMAVNEENACGGRVVTAPTNGAAGVVPAVMQYVRHFHAEAGKAELRTFLLTSAAIGAIIKRNASISGAEVGCQGEVGSASAMAAAGLAAIMGGSPAQIENAAEIALEHHLGMTCDPVKGLVQVPCIERNAFGAVKAVTAASLAMKGDGSHFVPLDACIETMRQTGRDMDHRYKETSLGGLAVNLPEC
ncbi:serine dehydratase [Aureimonas sp. Leaf454]|uniref:L-serine ammonia-lyase n=1 Tax=Aureimonas sp. Leaf454 TaxID=1736381 RepID=UPI0006F90E1A|nr:L-serine ammonia-lyase [Aureimonas sp. Leaf454]KQT48877.1 serine dehydratase [Aureimonas sp. Leaf454]